MKKIPQEKGIDHSLNLMREGYMYIPNRCHSLNTKMFKTRLLGQQTICMMGKEAAELFYDNEKFKRHGVAPNRAVQTLFGQKSVQTLDESKHKHRKTLLMSAMTKDKLKALIDIAEKQWTMAVDQWESEQTIVLYEAAQEIMCRIACEWVGIPIQENKVKRLTKDLAAMFEAAAAIGPKHWAGRKGRNRVEKWLEQQIVNIRAEKKQIDTQSILYDFVWHHDLEGNLLDPKIVAVEVINLLRPIVAISIYINFIALALYQYPNEKAQVVGGEADDRHRFVQEVRRFYPFFPFAMAKVKRSFIWNDRTFKKGTFTLLDLYGTNHDSDIWKHPNQFRPVRFKHWGKNPYNFIPQGGGDYLMGHRCAGEWVTIDVMKVSLDFLARRMRYDVPEQDLSYSMVNMPSMPKSKMIITNVQATS